MRAKPGITIAELADAMGIKANYLYRVLPTLASDGQVKRAARAGIPPDLAACALTVNDY